MTMITLLDVDGKRIKDIESEGTSEAQITAAAGLHGYEFLDMWDDREVIVRKARRGKR